MKQRTVIHERTDHNYSVYSPDVSGCVATGKTWEEAERNFREALEFHIEGLKVEWMPVPEPSSDTGTIIIAA